MTPWTCDRCGKSGETRDDVAVLFHRCDPPRRVRRRIPMPEVKVSREESRNAVWSGLLDAIGGDPALWRDVS